RVVDDGTLPRADFRERTVVGVSVRARGKLLRGKRVRRIARHELSHRTEIDRARGESQSAVFIPLGLACSLDTGCVLELWREDNPEPFCLGLAIRVGKNVPDGPSVLEVSLVERKCNR